MDLTKDIKATVTEEGQITPPKEARDILNVSGGGQVSLIYDGGFVIMASPFTVALRTLQEAVNKKIDESDLGTEEEIVKLCKEIRRENGIH
ncbi:MAG: AbrB/MazE/SpoVT family DNA-binding domain-containing protein [Deltaproteobacteria bacterium]|jgi:AbrB family looped-hinge helix DNA binding protein|nr:AbrB/MazE/SpoVT family DNA-binding domain-containing protein [Deltaproteobacteria bacterium]